MPKHDDIRQINQYITAFNESIISQNTLLYSPKTNWI